MKIRTLDLSDQLVEFWLATGEPVEPGVSFALDCAPLPPTRAGRAKTLRALPEDPSSQAPVA